MLLGYYYTSVFFSSIIFAVPCSVSKYRTDVVDPIPR
jgi:hypothetical protein